MMLTKRPPFDGMGDAYDDGDAAGDSAGAESTGAEGDSRAGPVSKDGLDPDGEQATAAAATVNSNRIRLIMALLDVVAAIAPGSFPGHPGDGRRDRHTPWQPPRGRGIAARRSSLAAG
jgi:hypothetical protein